MMGIVPMKNIQWEIIQNSNISRIFFKNFFLEIL